MTTKIEIPAHLCEYLCGKFCSLKPEPVRFPDNLDIYHLIYDLLERRPAGAVDHGNLEIYLPHRKIGKSPEEFNYLGKRSQSIIIRKIELMMWAEVHDFLDEQKHRLGIDYIDGVHTFMKKYGIDSLTEDAFLKNYQRWRAKVRRKGRKREYKKQK